MSLLTKFAVLALMLCLTVLVSVGIPMWSINTVDREVMSAQGNLVIYVDALDRLRTGLNLGIERLRSRELLPEEINAVVGPNSPAANALDELVNSPKFREVAGVGVAPALADEARKAMNQIGEAATPNAENQDADPKDHRAAAEAQYQDVTHLLNIVQQQLLADLHLSMDHARDIRGLMQRVSWTALGTASIVGALTLMLLRRWVILPVLELRAATREITAGNFDYRIPITSRDELGVLSAEVNQMAGTIAQMQAEVVERERFTAFEEITRRLAHNLRNPLAGIRSLAEAARHEMPQDSHLREDQTLIIATVDRFEHWLGSLLRSAAPLKLYPAEESPREMLESVLHSHEPLAQARNIKLEIVDDDLPTECWFDRIHLEQAMVALTTNAIEATPEGGSVRLKGEPAPSNGGMVLTIEDSGPGIPDENVNKVFRTYFTTKRTGTGMGLPLVQKTIREHGGRVVIDHSELGGALFRVELPGKPSTETGASHG